MTTKQYLNQIRDAKHDIEKLQARIAKLNKNIESLKKKTL